ncbi:hypothetical protein GGR50DRAFT_651944 [Xylaria sp. CBS 124048]|nr:hypothetical protein GGR50DRAFT_651944 [Xylaria sp. CBS 124048]
MRVTLFFSFFFSFYYILFIISNGQISPPEQTGTLNCRPALHFQPLGLVLDVVPFSTLLTPFQLALASLAQYLSLPISTYLYLSTSLPLYLSIPIYTNLYQTLAAMADFSPTGLAFFIIIIFFTTICGTFVSLRLIAALISGRRFYLDDGFIVFAYINMVALGGVGLWACVNGIGKPSSELTPDELAVNAKLIVASDVCWLLGSVFVKLSIVCLYYRVFEIPAFRRWSKALLVLISLYGVSFIVVYLTNCIPVDNLWNPQPGGHCRDPQISDYATLAINLFLDLSILILPMPPLWRLRLAFRKKVIVTIMFSLGIGTIIVMLYRIAITVKVRDDPDFTAHLAVIGLVTGLEVWFGIVIACIPTLAPLAKLVFGRFMGTQTENSDAVHLSLWNSKKRANRKRYDEITTATDLTFTQHADGALLTTEIAHNPGQSLPSVAAPDAIYVQNQFESRDS